MAKKKNTTIFKTFRIYPQTHYPPARRGRYWKVNVFKTREDMLNYSREIGNTVTKRGFGAQTQRILFHRKRGTAIFYGGNVNVATVSHEMGHIAIAETPKTRRGVFKNIKDEERFCYLLDSLIQQFWNRYNKGKRAK